MSSPPIRDRLAAVDGDSLEVVPRSIRHRRAEALRARRRRALVLDLFLGFALAVLAIAIAPGLAIVALGALLLLFVCGASLAYERARARTAPHDAERSPGWERAER